MTTVRPYRITPAQHLQAAAAAYQLTGDETAWLAHMARPAHIARLAGRSPHDLTLTADQVSERVALINALCIHPTIALTREMVHPAVYVAVLLGAHCTLPQTTIYWRPAEQTYTGERYRASLLGQVQTYLDDDGRAVGTYVIVPAALYDWVLTGYCDLPMRPAPVQV